MTLPRRPRPLSDCCLPTLLVTAALFVAFAGASSCKKRDFNAKAASDALAPVEAFRLPAAFCDDTTTEATAALSRRDEVGHIWSAGEVQAHIGGLLKEPDYAGWPSSAYAVAYKSMTAQRDKARCDPKHVMHPKDRLDRALNDALADIMTRNLINVSKECFGQMGRSLTEEEKSYLPRTKLYQSDLGGLWCSLFAQAHQGNWDSIRFAMAATGLYLTINLGYGLSALPHIDALWDPKEFPTYESRVKRLSEGGSAGKGFRPAYDSFNDFLAKALDVVAGALTEGGLVKCQTFNAAAALGEYIPVFDDAFGMVRTRTFDIGVEIARATKQGDHPLVQPVLGTGGKVTYAIRTDVMKAEPLERDPKVEEAATELVKLGEHIRRVFGTRLFGLFGGVDFKEAKAFKAQGREPKGCL